MNPVELILTLAAKHSAELPTAADRIEVLKTVSSMTDNERLKADTAQAATALELFESAQRRLFDLTTQAKPQ